jgi:hypothetical protein
LQEASDDPGVLMETSRQVPSIDRLDEADAMLRRAEPLVHHCESFDTTG